MIAFSLLGESIELNSYDLLIFTSKQSVKSAERLNPLWKHVPCISIGSATSRQIEELGGSIVHQSQVFDGKTLSKEISKNFRYKKMLYLRPKVVSFDMKSFLKTEGLEIDEQVLYETSCIAYAKAQAPSKNAIIIFTSPSTIDCFFKSFTWDNSYIAVVIGASTKLKLPTHVRSEVANEATIDACIAKAHQLLNPNRL
jgi:uroporphyrinogen-III synthase